MSREANGPWSDARKRDIAEAREFLLPSTEEIACIRAPGWVEPRSMRSKRSIIRLLGWEDSWPFPEGFTANIGGGAAPGGHAVPDDLRAPHSQAKAGA